MTRGIHAAAATVAGIAFLVFLYWSVKASQHLRRDRPFLRELRTAIDQTAMNKSDFVQGGWPHQKRAFVALAVALVAAIVWQISAP